MQHLRSNYVGGGPKSSKLDYRARFRKQLEQLGLYPRPIKGDGSCLFRAISDQLEGDQNKYYEIYREIAVQYMDAHRKDFASFITDNQALTFTQYIKQMSKPTEYASQLEMKALSSVLDIQFIVHELGQPPLLVRDHEDRPENSRTLHLAYYPNSLHYESVRSMDDHSKTEAKELKLLKVRSKRNQKSNRKDQAKSKTNNNSTNEPSSNKNNWNIIPETENYQLHDFTNVYKSKVEKKMSYRKDYRSLTTPLQFFQLFFSEEILDKILEYTNQRGQNLSENIQNSSHQKQWEECSKLELKAFLGICMHMGITRAVNLNLYWSSDPRFRIPGIADIISRDRFKQIKRSIKFGHSTENNQDKLILIRPIFDLLSKNCERYWIPTQHLSLDESMIGYKGKHSGTVYMPKKPTRNGFKMFVLASSNGYVMRFIPSFCYKPKTKIEKIVFDLIKGYERKGLHLFMDR